jgi:LysR family transcriptional regulator, transcription activator of glutamate synthase operon
MTMELRQLIYFDAVVRHGGFTRAAERLHVAQPAISAQLKRLETELGTELLRRNARTHALTEAGELFLARARRILAELQAARTELEELSTVLRGTVRIGATQVLGGLDLPSVLAAFRHRYPGVTLSLRTALVAELVRELDAGALDVVVGPSHPDLLAGKTVRRLASESVVLAVPPGHRLARAGRVRLAEARDESFVCLPAGSGLHAILHAAAAKAGFEPRIDFQTHSPASIRELVGARLGVALVAASTLRTPGPAVAACELVDQIRHPPIVVVTHTPPAAATRALMTHLRDAADTTTGTAR